METATLRDEMVELVKALIPTISDDCRTSDEDEEPSIQLTVGIDDKGHWNYQTGDNSFTGGAYGFQHWSVVYLCKDSKPEDVADDIVGQYEELTAW